MNIKQTALTVSTIFMYAAVHAGKLETPNHQIGNIVQCEIVHLALLGVLEHLG